MPKERPARLKAEIGVKIAELRRGRQLTQELFAAKLDVSVQWLSRAENGHENLTVETLCKLANGLGVRVREFFCGDEALPSRSRVPAKKARRASR